MLTEAIANAVSKQVDAVYVRSLYPEIFHNHPNVIGISLQAPLPPDTKIIDLNSVINPVTMDGWDAVIVLEKWHNMCASVGLRPDQVSSPKLYLSKREQDRVQELKEAYPGRRLGVAIETSVYQKNWPNIAKFIKLMTRSDTHVFIFAKGWKDSFAYLEGHSFVPVFDKSLREAITIIAAMSEMVGPDTGLMHISSALNIPSVVVGFQCFSDMYGMYESCKYEWTPNYIPALRLQTARRVKRAVNKQRNRPKRQYSPGVALVFLEGLGGTVTASDHAKKIADAVGEPVHLIVRNYSELFTNNPAVADVDCVAAMEYGECIHIVTSKFRSSAVIKTGIGRWYGAIRDKFPVDWSLWESLYDTHPQKLRTLESLGLNMVQTANLSLGLPHENIDTEVFNVEPVTYLPDKYIAMSNGVDTWHRGLSQTKCWPLEAWEQFVEGMRLPVVQFGTHYDALVRGAIDCRGKTSIPELLGGLRDASAIVCTEGGLMHLGKAVGNDNIVTMKGPTRGAFYSYPDIEIIDAPVCSACYWDTPLWYEECRWDAACMNSIRPARVIYRVQEMLDANMV